MNCREIVEQIIAQPGRPVLAPEVEAHIAGCRSCSTAYLEQLALWRTMDTWEAPDVSPGFDQRLFARIGRRVSEPGAVIDWLMRLFQPLQPRFITALACMLILAAVVVERGRNVAPQPANPPAVASSVERDDPQQIQVALDDIQMLNDFDILPVGPEGKGKS